MVAVEVVLVIAVWLVPPTICLAKGKPIIAVCGYFGIGLLFVWVGSVRLALPGSRWADRFYDSGKLARSHARFSDDSEVGREGDREILAAWDGVEIKPDELDPITRRALRRVGRI